MSERPEPLIGVQLGPHSVFDEGVEPCLDILAKKAAVNAVFVYSQTYYPGCCAG